MSTYAAIDQHGLITSLGDKEMVPNGIKVAANTTFHPHFRQRLINGQITVTDIPLRPPFTGAVWSEHSGQWIDGRSPNAIAASATTERNQRLAASDWLILRAQEQGQPVPQEWLDYRQQLRDITEQPGWPTSIQWPQAPNT